MIPSFKEHYINEDHFDLSDFNILVKAKPDELDNKDINFFETIDLSTFNTIIKQKDDKVEVIQVPEAPIVRVVEGKDGKDGVDGKSYVGRDGKDGITPSIVIEEVLVGSEPVVENVGTETDIKLKIVLPEAVHGTDGINGVDGKNGNDGKSTSVKVGNVQLGEKLSITNSGDNLNTILDFVLPAPINGINGITPTIKINSIQEGLEASVTNSGTDTEVLLDFILTKAKDGEKGDDGKDGYTPIKDVDYSDGYTPLKGTDYFDGKDGEQGIKGEDGKPATIKIGKVTEGEKFNVENWGTDNQLILDFTYPTFAPPKDGTAGKDGVDGKDGIDGVDGKDGVDGYTPVKNVDYFDGKAPEHQINDFGNIRFKNPDKSWGDWINIYGLIDRMVKHNQQKGGGEQWGGGGSNLDFIIDSNVYQNVNYLNIDTSSLLPVFNNGILTLGVNPSYVPKVGTGGWTFTFDYFKLQADNTYNFALSKPLIFNSETVILNGVVLTFGLDYDVIANVVVIDSRHLTKKLWNLTVKYAFDATLIVPELGDITTLFVY